MPRPPKRVLGARAAPGTATPTPGRCPRGAAGHTHAPGMTRPYGGTSPRGMDTNSDLFIINKSEGHEWGQAPGTARLQQRQLVLDVSAAPKSRDHGRAIGSPVTPLTPPPARVCLWLRPYIVKPQDMPGDAAGLGAPRGRRAGRGGRRWAGTFREHSQASASEGVGQASRVGEGSGPTPGPGHLLGAPHHVPRWPSGSNGEGAPLALSPRVGVRTPQPRGPGQGRAA